jgi:hypothetical protein
MSWRDILAQKVVQRSEGSETGSLEYQRYWPILTILGVNFDMAKNTVFQFGQNRNFLALRNRKSVTRYLCVFLALFDQTVWRRPFLGPNGPKYPFLTLFSLFLTPFLSLISAPASTVHHVSNTGYHWRSITSGIGRFGQTGSEA